MGRDREEARQRESSSASQSSSSGTGGSNRFVYVAAAIAALSGALFGYDTGVISGALLYIQQDFSLSSTLQELVVSGVLVGAVIGAAVGGKMADGLGRSKLILIAAAVFFVGALGMALAQSVAWLIAARFVVGLAIGAASLLGPLYISEAAPPKIRGSIVSFNQLAITGGILLAYLVDYGLSYAGAWRLMLGLGAVPAAALGVGMLFMPESPRWLVNHGRVEEARKVLVRRSGDAANVDEEVKEIEESIQEQSGGASELLQRWLRPRSSSASVSPSFNRSPV